MFAYVLLGLALALPVYAYVGYPILLLLLAAARRRRERPQPPAIWPLVSVTVPVYNEQAVIRRKIERVLAYDYPRDRLQVLVVSDASTDRTDEIVKEFASQGVELLRLEKRGGKTAAENAALARLRGEIVVNSDASIRVPPSALKQLVACFADPTVGVASGRDVSVANVDAEANVGESGYVGYEMGIRRLETRVAGIVGASGCFYAARWHLHRNLVPEALSRDFAAPLIARRHGYRSVSVDQAAVLVPRVASLRREYRRKVRTIARGLQTLSHERALLNPFRYGLFAWELWSHKLARWLVPWGALLGLGALAILASSVPWACWALVLAALCGVVGILGALWPEGKGMPRLVAMPAYFVAANVATLHAWINALRGELNPIWEPTRRGAPSEAK